MKKIIFVSLLAIALFGSAVAARASLWGWYQEQGLKFPSVQERATLATEAGISDYRGDALQNAFLEAYLRQGGRVNTVKYWVDRLSNGEELSDRELRQIPEEAWAEIENQIIRLVLVSPTDFLGGGNQLYGEITCKGRECDQYIQMTEILGLSVVTRYRTTLSASLTSSASTIAVTSMRTFDNTTLSMAILGEEVYLTIDPGNSREEIVRCTGISAATFTGCVRGLAFSGTSTAAVAANQEAHTSGAIIMMANVHYVYDELVDRDSNEEISGLKTFTSGTIQLGNNSTFTDKDIRVNNGEANEPFLRYDEDAGTDSAGRWIISHNGSDTFELATSSAGISFGGLGISIVNNTVLIDRLDSATSSGFSFHNDQVRIATTSANGITTNADGLAFSTSTAHVITASTTFSGNVVFTGSVSSTAATSTHIGADIVSSSRRILLGGVDGTNLFGNSTTQALNLHHHPSSTAMGFIIKAVNETGAETYNHGLGVVPSAIFFIGMGSCTTNHICATAGYATTTVGANQGWIDMGITGTTASQSGGDGAAFQFRNGSGTAEANGTVTAMTTQTFTINWGANSANGSARQLIWIAVK